MRGGDAAAIKVSELFVRWLCREETLDELHDGPELPMFCEDTNDMDPRMLEALAARMAAAFRADDTPAALDAAFSLCTAVHDR